MSARKATIKPMTDRIIPSLFELSEAKGTAEDRTMTNERRGYTSVDPGWKVCTDCRERKPITEFQKHRTGSQGVQSRCRPCANAKAAQWRAEHPYYSAQRAAAGYFRETVRWRKIEARYGLTKEQFHAMEAAQGGRCAICGREARLVIDHCHASGKVRGLLCNRCNGTLAALESPGWLESAQAYLADHPAAAALGDGVEAAIEAVRRLKFTSRHKGVFWETGRQKWQARIRVGTKVKILGRFDSEDEAAEACRKARQDIDESDVQP